MRLEARSLIDPKIAELSSKFIELKEITKTNEEVKIGLWSMLISGVLQITTAGVALYNKEAEHPEIIFAMSLGMGIIGLKILLNGLENYKPKP